MGWGSFVSAKHAFSTAATDTVTTRQLVLSPKGAGGRVTLDLPNGQPVSFYVSSSESVADFVASIEAEVSLLGGENNTHPNVSVLVGPTPASSTTSSSSSSSTSSSTMSFVNSASSAGEDAAADSLSLSSAAKVASSTPLGNLIPSPVQISGGNAGNHFPPVFVTIGDAVTRILPVVGTRHGEYDIGAAAALAPGHAPGEDVQDYDQILAQVRAAGQEQTQMGVDAFFELAAEHGVEGEDAKRVLACLHGAGEVLYFEDEPHMRNTVFLNPDAVDDSVRNALRIRTLEERDSERDRRVTIINLLVDRLQPLVDTKAALDEKATAHGRRVMWAGWTFSAAQLAFIARLTWWEFSWDVMEPISYILGCANVVFFYALFQFRKTPVDSFSDLQAHVADRKAQKLYKKHGFDQTEFDQLSAALDWFEREEAIDLASQELIQASRESHPEQQPPQNAGSTPRLDLSSTNARDLAHAVLNKAL